MCKNDQNIYINVSKSSILNSPRKWGHDVLTFPTMCIKEGIFGSIMLGSSNFSHLIIILNLNIHIFKIPSKLNLNSTFAFTFRFTIYLFEFLMLIQSIEE